MNKDMLIAQAAKWWTDQLRDRSLTPQERSAFQSCLEDEIAEFLSDKCWDPERPNWGLHSG